MTLEIASVLFILLAAIILFISDKLRVDMVAIMVLIALAITGLVTPEQALSGFSNPAVITIGAVFVLSGGLFRTGVAEIIGHQVLRLSGQSEMRLVAVIMLTAGTMSAFMNNVGVAALLLPVVLIISRRVERPPSKLLIPLTFGCLLGGLTTLIGTSPNILANEIVQAYGLPPLRFFNFLPVGLVVMLSGIAFMVLLGRRLLPERDPLRTRALDGQSGEAADVASHYDLQERFAVIEIPPDNPLVGKTLAESRLGQVLGLTILGLQRQGRKRMTIQPETVLQSNDQLLALGRTDQLTALSKSPYLVIEPDYVQSEHLISKEIGFAELLIKSTSPFIGKTIADVGMRRKYDLKVVAIRRQARTFRTNLQAITLQEGDLLVLQGERAHMIGVRLEADFQAGLNVFVKDERTAVTYGLLERMLIVRIPATSPLVGQALVESQLGQLFGLEALGIIRNGEKELMPTPEKVLMADDLLLVEGKPDALEFVRGLQGLVIKQQLQMDQIELETDSVGLAEAILSPFSSLVNKTLREIHFREKYGLSVLAIWRNGRAYRSELGDMQLQFGDAFLLYGSREKINLLNRESDFIVLQEEIGEATRRNKAWLAGLIMFGVITTAIVGWAPIALATLTGATLMVLTGCLDIEEAYRFIEWRAVFLVACMLTLGVAIESSGTASYLAQGMLSMVGGFGDMGIMAGLFMMTTLAAQFIPSAVVMVLMAPIALNVGNDLGISLYSLIMVVAIGASTSYMSPVGHPVNVLIMGPGGYRFTDYTKVGLPLTIVVLLVTLLVLPLVWPLQP
ncbi:SLC13 family permease [Candidatus Leptofilum sp.]|uniref:SLC13 family permease n=1 Tax=Candidatus Leptofilum sp. TaxID=3241576 RepID=UPI003B598CD3